jgi:ornithine cyclodeaminase
MKIIGLEEIKRAIGQVDLMSSIEAGFVAYSEGRTVVPPVGELILEDPPGEVHIKYGYLKGDEYYVIKVASGFYGNAALGLPTGDGLMLLFSQRTGTLVGILIDHAHLTDVRTAVAGALAARALAPPVVEQIGIIGTGVQARLQVRYLAEVLPCRRVMVWGRRDEALEAYRSEMEAEGYEVTTTLDASEVGPACQLIVTATPSTEPLIRLDEITPGTHITAVGSDTVGKQELDHAILGRADRVVVDSVSQCSERGELAHALAAGLVEVEDVVELGSVLGGSRPGRTDPQQITVADLTGLAVQDVQAAKAVMEWIAGAQTSEEESP